MATWPEVTTYVRGKYVVERQHVDELLSLKFSFQDGRSQTVYLQYFNPRGLEWVRVSSFVGDIDKIDLSLALILSGDLVGAGLQQIDDALVVTHYQLLSTIDAPEIDVSLQVVASASDGMEQFLVGTDER